MTCQEFKDTVTNNRLLQLTQDVRLKSFNHWLRCQDCQAWLPEHDHTISESEGETIDALAVVDAKVATGKSAS
jgi:hypothetical protein